MDLCKKCCSSCFNQPPERPGVKYAELKQEPSHQSQETVFKFPQAIESRPSYPPMFQRRRSKRLNSPHTKKMSQVVVDEPRFLDLPLTNRCITRQRKFMEPLMLSEQKSFSSESRCKQPQQIVQSSSELKLDSPLYANTVARITGKKLSSQCRIEEGFDYQKPSLQFSLEYDIVLSVLTVHLMAAFNLPAMDYCGSSDPYVEITLYPNQEKAKSRTIEKCLNPKFDQKFVFRNVYHCDTSSMILHFFVYDRDKFKKNDKIGSVNVTLEDANLTGDLMLFDIDIHSKRKKENKGTILLSLSYDDYFNSLQGTVLKLGNLAVKDIVTGKSDPYVKIELLYQGKRLRKWKSSTKMNDLNPEFHESFQFDLQDQSINDCRLCITVYDRDHLKQNDVIGRVCIGADVAQSSARKHWEEMLVSPQKVSRLHSLL